MDVCRIFRFYKRMPFRINFRINFLFLFSSHHRLWSRIAKLWYFYPNLFKRLLYCNYIIFIFLYFFNTQHTEIIKKKYIYIYKFSPIWSFFLMESFIQHTPLAFIPISIRVDHGIYLVTTICTIATKLRSVSQNYMFEQSRINWPLERRRRVQDPRS